MAQAVAVMEGLRTKRRDTGLDTQIRRAPKFGDYADRYLEAISAGARVKKHRLVIGEKARLKQWREHLGDIRLDQIRKAQVHDFITRRLKADRRSLGAVLVEWRSRGALVCDHCKGAEAAPSGHPRHNLTGDPYFTDGLRAAIVLCSRAVKPAEVVFRKWEMPPEKKLPNPK